MTSGTRARAATTYLAVLATAFALTGTFAASAAADPAPRPVLEVTGEFDQPSYELGERVTITMRITNVGPEPAVGLHADQPFGIPTDVVVDPDQWGDLRFGRPGVNIAPGDTHETVLSGEIRDLTAGQVTLTGMVWDRDGFGVKQFAFGAPVQHTDSHVAGTLFGDRNGNGVLDTGEALPNTAITLTYFYNAGQTFTATSDAAGRFDFGPIPPVTYVLGGVPIGDLLLPLGRLDIDPSKDNTNLLVRAVPPLNGALRATVEFTRDSYRPGELAHVTVALSNSGSIPLAGIVAACNRGGASHGLNGTGPGWGDLSHERGGVTLAPGETVPENAIHEGFVFVSCDFGYAEVDIDNHAFADDEAAVPGGSAGIVGEVSYFPEGHGPGKPKQGVAGVWAILVSDGDRPIVDVRKTDAAGHFEFHGLDPRPEYRIYFVPPREWTITSQNPSALDVRGPADQPARMLVEAAPRP